MIIFPYPKPTKCYGDTVIRRAGKVDCITEKVDFHAIIWLFLRF